MPIPITMAPMIIISIPYVIQSGLAYMKDDSGPTMDCPWRSKITPKMNVIMPITMTAYPFFMPFQSNFS